MSEFEQWYKREHCLPSDFMLMKDAEGNYVIDAVHGASKLWQAAKQSMHGDIAELQAQVDALRKDADMWRSVSFSIEEAIRNGMCNCEIEDAYETAISKGGE